MSHTYIALNRLVASATEYVDVMRAQTAADDSLVVAKVIDHLQLERGLTSMYISSNYTNTVAYSKLAHAR